MARHSQKADRKHMICKKCEEDKCVECVDTLRSIFFEKAICECRRKKHNGEPRDEQILDPETGTVHAPGLTVTEDGTVTFNG